MKTQLLLPLVATQNEISDFTVAGISGHVSKIYAAVTFKGNLYVVGLSMDNYFVYEYNTGSNYGNIGYGYQDLTPDKLRQNAILRLDNSSASFGYNDSEDMDILNNKTFFPPLNRNSDNKGSTEIEYYKALNIKIEPLPWLCSNIAVTEMGKSKTIRNLNPKFKTIDSITFIESTETQYAEVMYTDGKKRQMKASKVLDIVYPDITQKDIETMVCAFRDFAVKNVVSIQIETDIRKVYNESTPYYNGSCMQGRDYAGIYDDICKGIITLRNTDGDLLGRALLWEIEIDGETRKFVDKAYFSRDSLKPIFLEFINKGDYLRGISLTSASSPNLFYDKDGIEITDNIYIDCGVDVVRGHDHLPYFDRFNYYCSVRECFNNAYAGDELEGQDGLNVVNGDTGNWSDADSCFYEDDECVYIESDDDYRHIDDCVYSDYSSDWILIEDAVITPDGSAFRQSDCTIG